MNSWCINFRLFQHLLRSFIDFIFDQFNYQRFFVTVIKSHGLLFHLIN